MKEVRLGIIGYGNMGANHAAAIREGRVPRCRVTAVCDESSARRAAAGVPAFETSAELLASGHVDAVLIATPHYAHTTAGIEALKAGVHVLVEKPISVHKADALRLLGAHRRKDRVFAAMFNQRTDSFYLKIRDLVRGGELGEIRRVVWTITNWFRTEAYYSSGGWRATWGGEGGGVLLNQCPHNLDLFQWIFGMPDRVRGFCQMGRFHDIEVEDDVTAYFEYDNGPTAVFITSTGEAPGVNRLEISGERGRLVHEDGRLSFIRNEVGMTEFSRSSESSFATPPVWNVDIPVRQTGEQHLGILKNFVAAILDGAKLIAPAAEGLHSVELANAILLSSLSEKTVSLPISAPAFERRLKLLASSSKRRKRRPRNTGPAADFSASFR